MYRLGCFVFVQKDKISAIRPDRDKTGRQKNPRRSGCENSAAKMSANSIAGELPCVASEKDSVVSDDARTCTRSFSVSSTSGHPKCSIPVGDESVLATLCEIEHICNQLRDAHPVITKTSITLTDAVFRPSLIVSRSPVSKMFYFFFLRSIYEILNNVFSLIICILVTRYFRNIFITN